MKPHLPLFQRKFEIALTAAFICMLFCINITFKYIDFLEFKSHVWATFRGDLVNIIPLTAKDGRSYKRLYIKNDDSITLTTAYFAKDEFKLNMRMGFRVKTEEVDFLSFLKRRFYAQSVLVWANENSKVKVRDKIFTRIASQHEENITKELFGALFLALPISKELRDTVQLLGAAHLIAISGFHLGIIFGFLYALFSAPYRFLQNRYFPYRNARWDISLIVFLLLGGYLWLIDMTPSFLRSYVMGTAGFLFLWRGINALNFDVLFLCAAFLISLFPHLAFNIGFILSCFGVFFIFVYVRHFGDKFKIWQSAVILNFWLFFAMAPLAHYWFGVLSISQFACIPLSLLFVAFYPIEVLLHAIGQGGIFDGFIISLLNFKTYSIEVKTPLWLLAVYIALSFGAMRSRIFMLPLAFLGGALFLFLTG
ncbi:MAG: ComEC/Rec2 family competence protein [Campylobacteraceae bacterium]|jgi:competence protein ComEC|nr:ComEC/Rec2 family competence protein [Campylobacteraceae bacterium]